MNHLVHTQCLQLSRKSQIGRTGNYESRAKEEGQSSSDQSRQKGFVAATSPRSPSKRTRSSQHSLGTTAGYLITQWWHEGGNSWWAFVPVWSIWQMGGLKGPRTRFVTFPTLRKIKSAADKWPDYRLPILFFDVWLWKSAICLFGSIKKPLFRKIK
jgi:hypothetical protein